MQMTLISLMIFPRMSLNCKLVPVQYREYEYGLFTPGKTSLTSRVIAGTLTTQKLPQQPIEICACAHLARRLFL